MYKYAMIGYYRPSGAVYAVGNPGVTPEAAKKLADKENLESFHLFPLVRQPPKGGHHGFYRRDENGEYKRSRSRYFAAQVSPEYVAQLIEKNEADQ
jgi:hypothetical protein